MLISTERIRRALPRALVAAGLVGALAWLAAAPQSAVLARPAAPAPAAVKLYLPLVSKGFFSVPVSGYWSGSTSYAYPVSFRVLSEGTQWRDFSLMTNYSLPGCSGPYVVNITGPYPIGSDHVFGYSGAGFAFGGSFTSSYQASGTFLFTHFNVGCGYLDQSGTWAATFQHS